MTQRQVATAINLSPSEVSRHLNHHSPADAPPPSSLRMPPPPDDHPASEHLRELRAVHGSLLKTYANAVRDDDRRNVALLAVQLRANLAKRAELERLYAPPAPDSFDPLRDELLARTRDRLAEALEPFPEARALAVEALTR